MSDDPNEKPKIRSVFESSEPPEDGAKIFEEKITEEIPDNTEEIDSLKEDDAVSEDSSKITEDKDNFEVEADLDDEIDLFDHTDEVAAFQAEAEEQGVAPPDLPETEPIQYVNPGMSVNTTDAINDQIEQRFTEEFDASKVVVTAQERSDFVRAALTDSDLIFHVKLEGVGVVVSVAMPSDTFTNAASAAAYDWADNGIISSDSDLQWILTFQQMHAWYQIRAIDDKPVTWAEDWGSKNPSFKKLRKLLSNPDNIAPIQNMSGVRWRLILQAIRIAEQKYKICLNNWHNRTFFTGADTD